MARIKTALAVAMLAACGIGGQAAQSVDDRQTLASRIEERFDVLPVQNGVVLRPRDASRAFRSIELASGTIAIDGQPVTGSELRERLDDDADLVLQLSYLDAAGQRALFEPQQQGQPAADSAQPTPAPAAPSTTEPPDEPARPVRSSDIVRIGGDVEVGADELITGDVVAIGGNASVDGEVTGDVVAIGGNLELGPDANVAGDVVVVGGRLQRDPGARVRGQVQEVGFGNIPFPRGIGRDVLDEFPRVPFGRSFGSVFALLSTVTRIAILGILVSIVLLFGRGYVEQIGVRAAEEPLKAGLVGLLIQLLSVPVLVATIVVMVVTIIGIPLLVLIPFALVAFALLFLIGFTAVVYDVGRLAASRFGWQGQNPYLVAFAGIVMVLLPVVIGRLIGFGGALVSPITWTLLLLGFLAEYVAWTVGLGAVALVRFDRR
jgi:hypothetical protein